MDYEQFAGPGRTELLGESPVAALVLRLRERLSAESAGQMTSFFLVLVTAPNRPTARRLARVALENKLVACANLVPGIESHYWWQGRLERSNEVLVLFKTTSRQVPGLQRLILAEHPYDTPQFVALKLEAGSKRYLDWIDASVRPVSPGRGKE